MYVVSNCEFFTAAKLFLSASSLTCKQLFFILIFATSGKYQNKENPLEYINSKVKKKHLNDVGVANIKIKKSHLNAVNIKIKKSHLNAVNIKIKKVKR